MGNKNEIAVPLERRKKIAALFQLNNIRIAGGKQDRYVYIFRIRPEDFLFALELVEEQAE